MSLQSRRAADKINRRSLDTLTVQSAMFARVSVSEVRVKDVERHFEGVESSVEYAETIESTELQVDGL